MIKITDNSKCCGCGACENICPKHCISMQFRDDGFRYPVVDSSLCIDCNLCEAICPELKNEHPKHMPLKTLGGRAIKQETVEHSTSGGICQVLSEYFLNNSGVVYGAAYAEYFNVRHIRVCDAEHLNAIRNSKYLQSDLSGVLRLVRQDLKDGLNVLFIGTPCQIAGLKAYLKKDYSNLYTIDFVCHGVPSQKVFNLTTAQLQRRYGRLQDLNFRHKNPNWRGYALKYDFENASFSVPHCKSWFLRGFVSNLYLRPSCHTCNYNNHKSYADITVADLWGVEFCRPELDDNTGLNLIMPRNEKGIYLLGKIDSSITLFDYDYTDALKYNPGIEHAPQRHVLSPIFPVLQSFLPVNGAIAISLALGRIAHKLFH